MRIAFAQNTLNQHIGVMILAALARREGHTVELFVQQLETDLFKAMADYQPHLIGFGVLTGTQHWAAQTAQQLKRTLPRTVTVVGGVHPTSFPEMIDEPGIDVIARGEAEHSFPELIRRLAQGLAYTDIAGLWVKENGRVHRNELAPLVADISALPHPDHKLYQKYRFFREQSEVPLMVSRGCPYRCTFCCSPTRKLMYRGKGEYQRVRSVADVIAEIAEVHNLYPRLRSINFHDTICFDRQWISDFTDAYARHFTTPWFTSMRADYIDAEIAGKLARAGCFCISIGVETGDEEIRRELLGKDVPNAAYREAARRLRSNRIKVRTSNMMFLPGETVATALKTIDLNRDMQADFAWAYIFQPFPGTEIHAYALQYGHLPPDLPPVTDDPLGLLRPVLRVKEEKQLLVVHRLFMYAVRYRAVRVLLPVLMRLPGRPLYDLLYYCSMIASYAGYHQVSLWRAARIAWTNYQGTRKN